MSSGDPRTALRTTDANLDCAFFEKVLVFVAPEIGRALPPPGCNYYLFIFFTIDLSLMTALDVGMIVLG